MITKEQAYELRAMIEQAANLLSDKDALKGKLMFPRWNGIGIEYKVDERVLYNDTLFKCIQTHVSQNDWNPIDASSLWTKVLIPDPEVIPDWEQPDSTNPYMKGDKVRFNNKVYESLIDNNIWSPETYPAGWSEVANE